MQRMKWGTARNWNDTVERQASFRSDGKEMFGINLVEADKNPKVPSCQRKDISWGKQIFVSWYIFPGDK